MHIDYDYYDYMGEQDDKNRRMKNKRFLFWRLFFCLLVGAMLVFGFASLL